jgi:hypothetical protein
LLLASLWLYNYAILIKKKKVLHQQKSVSADNQSINRRILPEKDYGQLSSVARVPLPERHITAGIENRATAIRY